jgi:putative flippase GtrA
MENSTSPVVSVEAKVAPMPKKDYQLGILAGFLIGLLFLPVLNAAKPEIFAKVWFVVVPLFLIGTPFGLVIAYLISRKISIIWQIAKFGVTGVLNALVDLGMLTLFTFLFRKYLSIDSSDVVFSAFSIFTFYSIYKACSFIIANINSYYWNKYWTFQKQDGKSTEFIQFFIVSAVGFAVNVLIASLIFKFIGTSTGLNDDQAGLLGAVAGSIAGLAWNFTGYKFIVFKK